MTAKRLKWNGNAQKYKLSHRTLIYKLGANKNTHSSLFQASWMMIAIVNPLSLPLKRRTSGIVLNSSEFSLTPNHSA